MIEKITIIDVETVGKFDDLEKYPDHQKDSVSKWLAKLPDINAYEQAMDRKKAMESFYHKKAGLSDYAFPVCLSVAKYHKSRWISYSITDTKEMSDMLSSSDILAIGGHNIMFDVRKLVQHFINEDMPIPWILKHAINAKPWELNAPKGKVFDTGQLCFKLFGSYRSLNDACAYFNIPTSKDGAVEGSQVHRHYWFAEDRKMALQQICDYCNADTVATGRLLEHLIPLV